MSTAVPKQDPSALTLSDGRKLAWRNYGSPDGRPAFYFHGTTSSRLEGALYHERAREAGVHLITVDRPGAGASDPLPGRRLVHWPADVVALADHLGFDRYAVAGGSGGGPHALACAALTPARIAGVVLVNTAVPPQPRYWRTMPLPMRMLLWLYLHWPTGADYLARKMAASRDPAMLADDTRYAKIRRMLPEADRRVLDDPERRAGFAAAVAEGLRQSRLCFAEESRIFLGYGTDSWQFDPLHIAVPVVALYGDEDGSGSFVRELAAIASNARVAEFRGGHLCAIGDEAASMSMTALASFDFD